MKIRAIQLSRNKLVLLFSALFVATVTSLLVTRTFAQLNSSSQILEVSPPSQEFSVDPGKTQEIKSKVTNKSNGEVSVRVRVDDFTVTGDQGEVSLINKGSDSLTSWTKLDSTTFTLKSGESKTVTAQVSIPSSAAGGHYGSFVFASVPGTEAPGVTAVAQEVASLFLLKVSGPVSENVALENFTVPQFVEAGPVKFQLKFKNTGNIHIKPHGLIHISDYFGNNVKDIVFSGQNVFPGASRLVDTTLDKTFLIGPYKATAILYYGAKNENLMAETQFFAFPVRMAAAVLFALAILFLMRKRLFKALGALGGK
jgi:hypothetical protein